MVDDPFERVAEREQQLRQEHNAHAQRWKKSVVRNGTVPAMLVWAAFLAGHQLLFGFGTLFFVHASVFGIFVVMLFAEDLTPAALWAPFLVAHVQRSGWTTATKIHLYAFLLLLALLVWDSFTGSRWVKRRRRGHDL